MDEQAQAPTYTPRPGSVAANAIAYLLANFPRATQVESAALAKAIDAPANGLMSTLGPSVRAGLLKIHKVKRGANGARTNAYSLPKLDPFDDDEARGGKPAQRIVAAAAAPTLAAGPSSVFALAAHMGPGALPFDLAGDDTPAPPPEPTGLNWKPGKPLKAGAPFADLAAEHAATQYSSARQAAGLPAFEEAEHAAARVHAAALLAPQHEAPVTPPLECALWSNGELWLRIHGAASPLVLDRAQTEHLIHYLDRMAIEPLATTT